MLLKIIFLTTCFVNILSAEIVIDICVERKVLFVCLLFILEVYGILLLLLLMSVVL